MARWHYLIDTDAMARLTWSAALLVCLVSTDVAGRTLGYTSTSALLAFWVVVALSSSAAWRLARLSALPTRFSDTLIRSGVIVAAIIVGSTMLLGAIGRLALEDILVVHALVFAAAWWIARRLPDPPPLPRPATAALPPLAVAVGAAMVVFAVGYGIWHAPLTLYDSLSYHLHFAARWVQDRAIAIIPTPFSDEAQAYAPGNGELFLAWLMLPFHGDLLARIGQLPFALLGALSVYGIARQAGIPPAHAVYPALFFVLSRPIVEQMAGANVDLICAAVFLASVYLIVIAVERDDARDWMLVGVSAGLFLGTKYLAIVYAPLLVLLACARGPRARGLWALPGLAGFALPWYGRNWAAAGSPIYPADLAVGGMTLARGAFTRTAMLNTVFHTADVRLFPAMLAHAFGPALFLVWCPCAIGGWLAMARRGWWPSGALALMPMLMAPLYWYGLPVNIDSRFLMPALGPALLPLAFVFSRRRAWNACVHVLLTLAALWVLVGSSRTLPGSLPWFMNGWLALDGVIRIQFLPWFLALAAALAAVWLALRRTAWLALPATVSVAACGVIAFTAGAGWCGAAGCEYLRTTSPFIRAGYASSWYWIDDNISQATIAYTGINLPYPLTGRQLANRVVYVNIGGQAGWRFHDYDRAYRAGRWRPSAPALAASSGELMPVAARTGPRRDAVRPRYERMDGDREAWTRNLDTMRVQYLFVALLSAYEIDYVWHNGRGFPIEDDWAASDPVRFRLVYSNPEVHIYSIGSGVRARG